MSEETEESKVCVYTFAEGVQVKFRLPLNWNENLGDNNRGFYQPDFSTDDEAAEGIVLLVGLKKNSLPQDWNLTTLQKLTFDLPPDFPTDNIDYQPLAETKWLMSKGADKNPGPYKIPGHSWSLVQVFDSIHFVRLLFTLAAVMSPRENPGEFFEKTVAFLEREIPLAEITLIGE